ncbi:MAG: ClC family H(+)/Cl(-) exchange transporter [Eubacteriales bacterium]|nr:ClC family H(+)/Cl(-) exchange transporter [Eubacteriales bacterium]
MKDNAANTLRRAEKLQVILIGEGILVGAVGGLVVLLYRLLLEYAATWLKAALDYAKGAPLRIAGWFVILMIFAVIVGKLLTWEPLISGSGIPQLEGEMTGQLEQNWRKVLSAKFAGGFLCILGGMSLGREGPSIQLGAMAGKGISRILDRGKTEERFLLTCGASAGLSAAFNAPLAGVMFSLEEVHKNFSVSVLLSVMAASLTADYLSASIFGMKSVFQFDIVHSLPQSYYWMILILGVILGVLGAFYNWFTLKVQSLYNHAKHLNTTTRLMIPFLCAGVLGFTLPDFLGSGHNLIEELTSGEMVLHMILITLIGKFIFSAICFGSGAPGGIFFPLLVLGAFIGGAFATFSVNCLGLDAIYVNNFVLLAMAGYFTAIVRAPLTGIILIFEMTGSVQNLLSLSIVSIVAYIVATLLRSKPIYESLLERLLEKRGVELPKSHGKKVLREFVVAHGSDADGRLISEVEWPRHCLLVAVQRGEEELIPKGKTRLRASDLLVTMTDERDCASVYKEMENICRFKGFWN